MRRLLIILILLAGAQPALAQGFTLRDSAGETHTLAQYKGKWVLVNFWATWCAPCLKEIPDFVAVYNARKGKDFVAFGIAVDYQNPGEVTEFARKLAMSYPLVLGDDKTTAQFGELPGLPVSFLYDPGGRLALKKIGVLPRALLEKYLDSR